MNRDPRPTFMASLDTKSNKAAHLSSSLQRNESNKHKSAYHETSESDKYKASLHEHIPWRKRLKSGYGTARHWVDAH